MPDIFDEVAAKPTSGDIFDQIAQERPAAKAKASSEMDRVTSLSSGLPAPKSTNFTAPANLGASPRSVASGQLNEAAEQRGKTPLQITPQTRTIGIKTDVETGPKVLPTTSNFQVSGPTQAAAPTPLPGPMAYVKAVPAVAQAGYESINPGKFYVEQGPEQLAKGIGALSQVVGSPEVTGMSEPLTTDQTATAESQVMRGGGVTTLPLAPEAAMAAPATTAALYAMGYGLSKGSRPLLDKTEFSEPVKGAIQDATWFLPSMAGLKFGLEHGPNGEPIVGVKGFGEIVDPATGQPSPRFAAAAGKTPEGGFGVGVKVGGTKFEGKIGGDQAPPDISVSQAPGTPQPTLPPSAAEAAAHQQMSEAIGAQAHADEVDHAAMTAAAGIPPTPPAPPQPTKPPLPPPSMEHLAPLLMGMIADTPEAMRPFAIQELHQNLVNWMLEHGTIQGPDGEAVTVLNQTQANKLADKWINDHMAKADKAAAAPQPEASTKEASTKSTSTFTSDVTNRSDSSDIRLRQSSKPESASEPPPQRSPAEPIRKGSRVTFVDNDGNERTGTIRNLNDLAARITPDEGGGQITVAPSKVKGLALEEAAKQAENGSAAGQQAVSKTAAEGSSPSTPANTSAMPIVTAPVGEEKKDEQTTKYKYGNTQAAIDQDSEAGKALASARQRISKDDLMPTGFGGDQTTGLEEQPHVTVRYGIKGDDTEKLKAFIESQSPFEATLGKTDSFPPSKHSDGAAPIIAPVESPELRRIEQEMDQHGEFVDRTFPEYRPHATVGYVKPDKAARYTGMSVTDGKKFTVNSISITDRNGNEIKVPLKGKVAGAKSEASAAAVEATPPASAPQTVVKQAEEAPEQKVDRLRAELKALRNTVEDEDFAKRPRTEKEALAKDRFGKEVELERAEAVLRESKRPTKLTEEKSKAQTHEYEAVVSRFAGDPEEQKVQIKAENRRHAESLLSEKYPGKRISDAYKVDESPRAISGPEKAPTKTESSNTQAADGNTITPAQESTHEQAGEHSTTGDSGVRATDGESGVPLAGVLPEAGSKADSGAQAPASSDGSSESGNTGNAAVSRPGNVAGSGGGSRIADDSAPAGEIVHEADAQEQRSKKSAAKKNTAWFAHPEDFSVDATNGQRLTWNLEAIKLLKEVTEKPRKLTDAEKDTLAHYVGWGALQQAFNPYSGYGSNNDQWARAYKQLKQLLSESEFNAAQATVTDAHYTSAYVVRFMWALAARFGVKGGNILESSMGVGNFLGMMPKGIRNSANAVGNEIDPTTFGVAQLLYQGATLYNKDFVQLLLPNDSFDLAIGNPPFGGQSVYDPNYRNLGKPKIHDYFFIKTLDKVRPGGLLMYITSAGTMDKQSATMRYEMAQRADLVQAYRFPSATFEKNAGTSVITDLLIFRKRGPNTEYAGEPFQKTVKVTLPYGKEWSYKQGQSSTSEINEYFEKHPENVLGTMSIGRGGTHQDPERMTVDTDNLKDELKKALDAAPRNLLQSRAEALPTFEADTEEAYAPSNLKNGSFTVDEKGNVLRNEGGKLVKAKQILDSKTGKPSLLLMKRMRSLIDLRDNLRDLMYQMRTLPDDERGNAQIAKAQKALQAKYQKHIKDFGYINAPANKKLFEEDPEYQLLAGLEDYNVKQRKGSATANSILTQRSLYPPKKLTALSQDNREAFYQILAERGTADIQFMAELSGKPQAELVAELEKSGLIFQDPMTGLYLTREKYLSGHVYEKINGAKEALAQSGDKKWERNIQELESVIPTRIPIKSDDPKKAIEIKPGATWIPAKVAEQFVTDILKGGNWATVKCTSGVWKVDAGHSAENLNEYAGGGLKGSELLGLALNQKSAVITKEVPNGTDDQGREKTKSVVDAKATAAARKAQDKVKMAFAAYIREHPEWAPKLEESYNQLYNGLVTPNYDGSHLTFPGMNKSILRDGELMPHQRDAIWRIIQEGRALLAHVVGAGKTFEMIASAMEMKRLGFIKKPMFAVPNHLTGQWARDFLKLYPGARILVPSKVDFQQANRRKLLGRIATGTWDAVIVGHSQFDMMDISAERQMITMQRQMDELEETIRAATESEGKNSRTRKDLERSKKKLKARMDALKDLKADNTIVFDELGVDQLYVDEAHEYKNLMFYTKMDRISGLSQGDAKKALRLKMKTEYLMEKHGNRGVVFATGTPISNTMAELRHMIAYLAPDIFEKAGIHYFDDWAANFGDAITAAELSADGRTYRPKTKFARFTNLPELQLMFRAVADVKLAQDLNLPVPEVETGKAIPFEVPASESVKKYVDQLVRRAKILKGEPVPAIGVDGKPVMVDQLDDNGKPTGKKVQLMESHERPDPTEDNMLKVTSDGIKAATDMRLHDGEDEPGSKINAVVGKIFELWSESTALRPDPVTGVKNSTGLVFLDNYQKLDPSIDVPEKYRTEWNLAGDDTRRAMLKEGKARRSKKALLNLYEDMRDKLVKLGIPKEQMAIIHEAKTDEAKSDLFDRMNEGKVRILFGSRKKMGAGMNAQKRMRWLIDVDSPWRPGDLEQGHGRLVRQGNLNNKVKIFWAVTKGSFDAYRIQTLKTKASFIGQVMSGKTDVRSCIDAAADSVMSYEDMMAAASDNPDVKRKIELEAELTNLSYAKEEFEAQRIRAVRDAEWKRQDAGRATAEADKRQHFLDIWNKAIGDKKEFHAEILGKQFDKYGDAAEFMKNATVEGNIWLKINGLDFTAGKFAIQAVKQILRASHEGGVKLVNDNVFRWASPWNGLNIDSPDGQAESFHGILLSITAKMRNLADSIRFNRESAERSLVDAEKYQKLSTATQFSDQARMDELQKELQDVENRLGINDEQGAKEQQVDAAVSDEDDEPEDGPDSIEEDSGSLAHLDSRQSLMERLKLSPMEFKQRGAKIVAQLKIHEVPADGELPAHITGDKYLMNTLFYLRGRNLHGVVYSAKDAETVARLAENEAEDFALFFPSIPAAAANLRSFAKSIRNTLAANQGIGAPVISIDSPHPADTTSEELFHMMVQFREAQGNIGNGVPWRELRDNPLLEKMRTRIERDYRTSDPVIVTAEAIVDVWNNEATELTPDEQQEFARAYFTHVSEAGLDRAQKLAQYLNTRFGKEWHGYEAPAQKALESVRKEKSGGDRGAEKETQRGTGREHELDRGSSGAKRELDSRDVEPGRSGTGEGTTGLGSLERRPTTFGMTVPGIPQAAEAVGKFWERDVAPVFGKFGIGLGDTAKLMISTIYPRIEESSFIGRKLGIGVARDAMDSFMQLKGDRDRALYMLREFGQGVREFFDHIPESARIDFLDRYKTGKPQATRELDELAKFYKAMDDAMYHMVEQYKPGLNQLEDHFRLFWKELPKPVDEKGNIIDPTSARRGAGGFFSKRPLEGSKGMLKKHTLATASEGLERGGVLVSTNPQTLFELGQADSLKFVTAHQVWDDLKLLGHRAFMKPGQTAPEGFIKLDDKIARVFTPMDVLKTDPEDLASWKLKSGLEVVAKDDIETRRQPVQTGEWWIEPNSARLLKNFLSRDLIRENAVGRGLLWMKNVSTAVELGLSPFHAVFETIESMGSQVGLGLTQIVNQGIRQGNARAALQGVINILSSPVAPVMMAREGGKMIAYAKDKAVSGKVLDGVKVPGDASELPQAPGGRIVQAIHGKRALIRIVKAQDFVQQHPDADIMLDDLFAGGGQLDMSRDFEVNGLKTMQEEWSAHNPIGAFLRAFPWAADQIMAPLFKVYIPRLKVGFWLKQYAHELEERDTDLQSGKLTRPELARQVWFSVENRFGEMNFDNLFWNRTFKTALQGVFRSVTWKGGNIGLFAGGTMRQIRNVLEAIHAIDTHDPTGGAGGGGGKIPPKGGAGKGTDETERPKGFNAAPRLDRDFAWAGGLAFTTVLLGTIVCYLATGKSPEEWAEEESEGTWEHIKNLYKETVHPRSGDTDFRGKPIRVSLPTYWKDLEHGTTSPRHYITGSFSSTLGRTIDVMQNRDFRDNYVYNPNDPAAEKFMQIIKYATPSPFSFRNYLQMKDEGTSKGAAVGSALGFTRTSGLDLSDAEKRMLEMKQASHEPFTPEQLEKFKQHRADLEAGVASSKAQQQYYREMDTPYLVKLFKGLPYEQAIDIYENHATPASEFFPNGRIYVLDEYLEQGRIAEDVAQDLMERWFLSERIGGWVVPENPRAIQAMFLSPDAKNATGVANSQGVSLTRADQMQAKVSPYGLQWTMASNDREGGWQHVYSMLRSGEAVICDNCVNLIQAIPSRQRDEKKKDDIKKVPGDVLDDMIDSFRYALYSWFKVGMKPIAIELAERMQAAPDPTSAMMTRLKFAEEVEKRNAPIFFGGKARSRQMKYLRGKQK